MSNVAFKKILTANDTGESGSHQAGIHIPKGEKELLAFLPPLDRHVKNPYIWIECIDENGRTWEFRYIHYNNKLHDLSGTRNEYRITHMTKYFRSIGARNGDIFVISRTAKQSAYVIKVMASEPVSKTNSSGTVKLKGWLRVH